MTDTEFDTKFNYYETVREELGLSAIWSIFEIENLSEPHPFKDAKIVSYKVYHGKEYQIEINGSTWAALFVAANAVIRDSRDYHIFIEAFTPNSKNSEILELHTGS
jgi:hypothetical protein